MKKGVQRCLMVLFVVGLGVFAGPVHAQQGYTLTGWNDLGMHCMDADFEVFSILPPYNTIHAQLIDPSGDLVTDPGGITVTYEAVMDGDGSINTSSVGKTNFWDNVLQLFGVALPVDSGLAGFDMPGATNDPQTMIYEPGFQWFTAEGIPITPFDDGFGKNYYPMMRLVARNASGQVLATTNIVLPVSDEMTCTACHGSGSGPAAMPSGGWIYDPDPERDYRLNAVLLHDDMQLGNPVFNAALATVGYNPLGLYATITSDGQPVLCAACHGSNALPGTGIAGIAQFTQAMHSAHAPVIDPGNGLPLDASSNRTACYTCHPGSDTRCLRGAMGNAVSSDGSLAMQCQSCHGNMSAVGASDRQGWFEEPNCQSCHTGTATNNNGQIRYTSSFDSSGEPRVAVSQVFATDPDTPAAGFSLYRFSTGHGDLQCSACHGSTHAIFPSSHANDNAQSLDLQGHVGVLSDCESCHGGTPQTATGGPHGLHPMGAWWVKEHHDYANSQCRACHGLDSRGTELSRAQGDRVLNTKFGQKNFWRGFQIGCYTCHNGPNTGDANNNRAPSVNDLSVATSPGLPIAIDLPASDPDGDQLELRVVSQSINGTVGLSGTTATYYPSASFTGSDSFTYAAWDGDTQSNLGTVMVSVDDVPVCQVACSAVVPPVAEDGAAVDFLSDAVLSSCVDPPSFEWDFGDGSGSTNQNTSHVYALPGTYTWTLTVSADGQTCSRSGSIVISSAPQCTLSCRAEVSDRVRVNIEAEFHGAAESEDCAGEPAFEWDFGDGSPVGVGAEVRHAYSTRGSYTWQLRVAQDGAECLTSGQIRVQGGRESVD